jgi:hypothetical protein
MQSIVPVAWNGCNRRFREAADGKLKNTAWKDRATLPLVVENSSTVFPVRGNYDQ